MTDKYICLSEFLLLEEVGYAWVDVDYVEIQIENLD